MKSIAIVRWLPLLLVHAQVRAVWAACGALGGGARGDGGLLCGSAAQPPAVRAAQPRSHACVVPHGDQVPGLGRGVSDRGSWGCAPVERRRRSAGERSLRFVHGLRVGFL